MTDLQQIEEDWGPDPFEDGARVAFHKQFSSGPRVYTYLAIRANGTWHITGQHETLPWYHLIAFGEKDNAIDLGFEVWEN